MGPSLRLIETVAVTEPNTHHVNRTTVEQEMAASIKVVAYHRDRRFQADSIFFQSLYPLPRTPLASRTKGPFPNRVRSHPSNWSWIISN